LGWAEAIKQLLPCNVREGHAMVFCPSKQCCAGDAPILLNTLASPGREAHADMRICLLRICFTQDAAR
jgi:hypothetical protein